MSSIFGTSKPTTNIFGAATTSAQSSAPQTSSLFGNFGSSQPQQTAIPAITFTSPSNSSTQPQQQSSVTSLFSNLGTSQPQQQSTSGGSTNIFGTAPPAASSGGGLLGSSQPASTGGAGGFFGSTQSAGSSLFAPKNTGTTQPTASSLFAPKQHNPPGQGTQGSSQQQQQQQQNGQQPAQGATKAPQPAYFDNLLEKGRKRSHDANGGPGFRDLPSLQLGLGDIAKRVREIGGVGTQTQGGRAADSRAHYLLAASGVNPGTTRRDLDSLATQPSAGTVQQPPDWDPDTHKFVEQLQQQSTLRMISDGLERAQRNFDAYLEENVDINWELQRRKIYEHFGLTPKNLDASDDFADGPGGKGAFGKSSRKGRSKMNVGGKSSLNRSIFGQSSLQKSVIGTPGMGS